MSFVLGSKSMNTLEGVHPDLVRVVKRAITLTAIDFGVSEGVRTLETQKKYVAEGKSTTMNSMHLPQKDGFSHAVDLFCYDNNGKVTWDHAWFRYVIQAMFTAAIEEGVQIQAGGLWRTFQDSPHFQLNQSYYK